MNVFREKFTYAFYEELLTEIKINRFICPIKDYAEFHNRPVTYLRHDIDVCLEAALKMAKLENDNNIFSTYMFMPNSTLYNIHADPGKAIINEIKDMGHEVSLHFDISNYPEIDPGNEQEKLQLKIIEESDVISSLIKENISSFSLHRPLKIGSKILFGDMSYVCGLINCYSDQLMSSYYSDSKGGWRCGDPLKRYKPMLDVPINQLLVHPIWWDENHQHPEERIKFFYDRKTSNISKELCSKFASTLEETCPGVINSVSLLEKRPK